MTVGVQIISGFACAAFPMEIVPVGHQRYLVRIESQAQGAQMIRILPIQKKIPTIARASLAEIIAAVLRERHGSIGPYIVGNTMQHIRITQIARQDDIRTGITVRLSRINLRHVGKTVAVVRRV